jgi:hypothetical protein
MRSQADGSTSRMDLHPVSQVAKTGLNHAPKTEIVGIPSHRILIINHGVREASAITVILIFCTVAAGP